MDTVICRENYGSDSLSRFYIRRSNGHLELKENSNKKFVSISNFFRCVFLPQGYPDSVSSDYLQYQIWDTIQAFCSSITGTLATQAVLQGVGVGDESATVLAATMTWLLKDGTGMLGRILFAWLQGSYLDCDCKRWRLFADILNDFAIFLEILAPLFKLYFRFIVCVAGVCKSIVGVAGGATRAALTQHQARRNNMADVSAKDGSQETLVNLAALLCSLMLIPLVTGNSGITWFLFVLFTILHLLANYKAVTSVTMETLNTARLHILMQHFLKSGGEYLSVSTVNKKEPVLWKTRRKLRLKLGLSLMSLTERFDEFEKLVRIYSGGRYLLQMDLKKHEIRIVLHERATTADQLQACIQAEVLEFAIAQVKAGVQAQDNLLLHNVVEAARHGDSLSMTSHSFQWVQLMVHGVTNTLETNGWMTSSVLLCPEEWRAAWDLNGIEDKKDF